MIGHRLALALALSTACASASVAPLPDASTVPHTATGTYTVTSQLDLVTIPTPAMDMLTSLSGVLDGPDDPSRYLLDRLIDALPGGAVQSTARDLAPVVAAYLQAHLQDVAPRLVPGLRALEDGLARVARHFGTIETWRIAADASATRAITALTVSPAGVTVPLVLAEYGVADAQAEVHVALDLSGNLMVEHHQIALPYGALLRLALDHAVIPTVDPTASDLATVLRDLVDCAHLGELVADQLIGPADLYQSACEVGLGAAAGQLYAQLPGGDVLLHLDLTGLARALDRDGDHAMDAIDAGAWTGTADGGSLGAATFQGTRE